MDQKRIRLEGQWAKQKKEITDLRTGVKHLQQDMDKLNISIAVSRQREDDLSNTTQAMETEFVVKLKEIEAKCVGLEGSVEGLRDEKNHILEEII